MTPVKGGTGSVVQGAGFDAVTAKRINDNTRELHFTQGAKDFAMFLRPRIFSQIAEPFVLFAECKTFDHFKPRDISRMEQLGKRFPGSILCFATL
jgi:hypothetical protein